MNGINIIFSLALIATSSAILADRSWMRGESILLAVGNDTESCSQLYSCLDCTTARLCRPKSNGEWEQVSTIPCAGDTPYCDKKSGTCSSVPDSSCGQTDQFICTQEDGYFPDVDCHIYHACNKYVSSTFKCRDTLVYSPEKMACAGDNVCTTFDCATNGLTGRKVKNSKYPQFFAYCTGGVATIIDKCGASYEFNEAKQVCEPVCHEVGLIRDLEDCTKYYFCHEVLIDEDQKVIAKERRSCPDGQGFDPSNFMCAPKTSLKNCS